MRPAAIQAIINNPAYRFAAAILRVPYHYFKQLIWEEDQAYGFAFVRQLWAAGWIGKIGFGVLIFSLVVSAWVLGNLSPPAEPGAAAIPINALVLCLVLFCFGSAFTMAFAIDLPLWAYTIVAAYLCWYSLLIGGSLAGTPGFALPTLWLFFIGWRLIRASQNRTRWIILGVLSAGAGYLTFGALSLGKITPAEFHEMGRWLFGLLFFGLSVLALRTTSAFASKPSALATFTITLLITGLFLIMAFTRDQSSTAETTLLAFQSLLGFVDLFWFWLGWTLLEGFLTTGDWGAREMMRVIPWRWFPAFLPLLWLSCAFLAWWLTGSPPLAMIVWAHNLGLDTWVYSWSLPYYFTVDGLALPSVVLALAVLVFYLARRLTTQLLANFHGIWIALILSLYGYYESMTAFATLEEDAAFQPGVWVTFLLVGGIVWELARSSAAYWESETHTRLYALTAFLIMLTTVSTITLSAGLPDLVKEYTLYSFLGVIYLGVPLVIWTLLPKFSAYEPPDGWGLLGLFALGIASAVLVLGIDPWPGWAAGLAPLAWGAALALIGRKLGRLEHSIDGIIAGSALALGFVTFWMSPEMLNVPFLRPLNDWQLRYLLLNLERPILLPGQFWFTLAGIGTGSACGWIFTRRVHGGVKGLTIILAALVLGLASALSIHW